VSQLGQLQTAIERARAAHLSDDRTAELSSLSKTAGAAEALMGMSSACNDCTEFRRCRRPLDTDDAAWLQPLAHKKLSLTTPRAGLVPERACDTNEGAAIRRTCGNATAVVPTRTRCGTCRTRAEIGPSTCPHL